MKKQYTKPTMESEAFVANEYIASCWSVVCLKPLLCNFNGKTKDEEVLISGSTFEDAIANNTVKVHAGVPGDNRHDNGNEESGKYYHVTNVDASIYNVHHEVEITLKGNGNSANAS